MLQASLLNIEASHAFEDRVERVVSNRMWSLQKRLGSSIEMRARKCAKECAFTRLFCSNYEWKDKQDYREGGRRRKAHLVPMVAGKRQRRIKSVGRVHDCRYSSLVEWLLVYHSNRRLLVVD